MAWPDDNESDAPLPITAFHVVVPEDVEVTPPEPWPHPSTWDVPGRSWDDLNDMPSSDPPADLPAREPRRDDGVAS